MYDLLPELPREEAAARRPAVRLTLDHYLEYLEPGDPLCCFLKSFYRATWNSQFVKS
jgi:hypothetical protein